jgi:hypothetical protein
LVQASELKPRQVLNIPDGHCLKPVTPLVLGRGNSRTSFLPLTSPTVLCTNLPGHYFMRGGKGARANFLLIVRATRAPAPPAPPYAGALPVVYTSFRAPMPAGCALCRTGTRAGQSKTIIYSGRECFALTTPGIILLAFSRDKVARPAIFYPFGSLGPVRFK